MRCIFCKCVSDASCSVEHIIPESLGNTEHLLPRGVVCDSCNNYFARKVEGPLLDNIWFKHARSRQWIPSKRRLVPPMEGIVPAARTTANVWLDGTKLWLVGATEKADRDLVEAISSGRARSLYLPIVTAIDEHLMARFLAKVAIEVLAHRLLPIEGWEEPLIDDSQLDALRRFARIGDRPSKWPFSRRRIYHEDDVRPDATGASQVLHEFTLLYTDKNELYAVICVFGEEFVINFGAPEIEGYEAWLKNHHGKSPLYLWDTLPISART